jgi:ribosomal protein S17
MTLLKGIVTKAGVMEKTITVTVERKVIHPTLLKVCLHIAHVVFTRPRRSH